MRRADFHFRPFRQVFLAAVAEFVGRRQQFNDRDDLPAADAQNFQIMLLFQFNAGHSHCYGGAPGFRLCCGPFPIWRRGWAGQRCCIGNTVLPPPVARRCCRHVHPLLHPHRILRLQPGRQKIAQRNDDAVVDIRPQTGPFQVRVHPRKWVSGQCAGHIAASFPRSPRSRSSPSSHARSPADSGGSGSCP